MLRKLKVGGMIVITLILVTGFSAFTPTTPPDLTAITLDFGPRRITLNESQLMGGWYNYDAWQKLTHGKNLFARAIKMQSTDTFAGTFPDIVHYLDQIASQFEMAPYDGQVNFFPHQTPRFTVTNQRPGRAIDRERLYQDIIAALKGNRYPVIPVHYLDVAPTAPASIVHGITRRSQFSTHCTDNPDRETNIALALSKFNGLRINPGEEVSFNRVVGRRTADAGFKTAKIIVKGEYVDGIGGGVCQVSTTIFNAVAMAGLHITQSHHHTLPSSYVPLGHDAMVSSGADLRFVNNTGAPVYLETKFQQHTLTATVYGRDKGPNINYRLATETVKTLAPKDAWEEDLPAHLIQDLARHPDGYERVLVQAGKSGYVVNTYLETYQGSRRLSRKLLRRATYQATPNRYTIRPRAVTLPLTAPDGAVPT